MNEEEIKEQQSKEEMRKAAFTKENIIEKYGVEYSDAFDKFSNLIEDTVRLPKEKEMNVRNWDRMLWITGYKHSQFENFISNKEVVLALYMDNQESEYEYYIVSFDNTQNAFIITRSKEIDIENVFDNREFVKLFTSYDELVSFLEKNLYPIK